MVGISFLRCSNLIYFHGKFHEWVGDNSTDENMIGFINYLAVDSGSQVTVGAACLGERGRLFDWIMNTLNQMICVWVADKEGFGAVTDYSVWKDHSHIWPACWISHVSHHSLFLWRKRGDQVCLGSKCSLPLKVLLLTAWWSSSYCNEEWWWVNFGYFSSVFLSFDKCSRYFLTCYAQIFVCSPFHFHTS